MSTNEQIGYGNLVASYLGIQLAKTQSLTDWALRPLKPAQLTYALEDVRYLPEIYQMQKDALIQKGRLAEAQEAMNAYIDADVYTNNPREAYKRIRRYKSMTRRRLAVLRELAAWREECAQATNKPRRSIASDEMLEDLVKRLPKSYSELESLRGSRALSDVDKSEIIGAIKRGLALPEELCPEPEPEGEKSSADESQIISLMQTLVAKQAQAEMIAPSHLAKKEDLLQLLRHPEEPSPLCEGWRKDVIGTKLLALIDGKLGLTVSAGKIEFLM